ncbi:TRAP transporter substrate-binding protein DctP [Billgrantia endophytica]|uniref:TRAP transporter substrate-binding protein DctP n=1 Tax=Billgrantia endophytica TaxID=2033802 RepID=UPI001F0B72BC|nr:TRAP transporter substrate-binding protein DctP [Halomonas endophytica]
MRFHSGYAESRPEAQHLNDFAAYVDELSGGELKIDVFHAGSLGLSEPDMLRVLQRGNVDMALLYGEYYTRDAPALAAVYAQGAITEPGQHMEILPIIREIYEEGFSKWGIQTIGGIVSPVFSVGIHCKEPINSLAQLERKAIRVWSSQLVDAFDRLSISAEVIPQNDMYMALQTGVVDCAYYLSTVAETVSLHEVAEYEAYLHPWAAVPAMFGVSQQTWGRLSDDHRQVLIEAGEYMWEKTGDAAVDPVREQAARERRESLGVTILDDFSEEDVSRFQEAAMVAWQRIAERAGDEGTRNYATVTEYLQEIHD